MKPEVIGKPQIKRSRQLRMKFHITMGLGFQIHRMRKARGWTQKELAARLGTARTTISRLEKANDHIPNLTTLLKIAEVFDVALIASFVPFHVWRNFTKDVSTTRLEAAIKNGRTRAGSGDANVTLESL